MSFAGLLSGVNDREELREHDRERLRSLCLRLRPGIADGNERLSPALLEELATLEGLDDDLDEQLHHPVKPTLGGLAETLEHIRTRFDRQPGNATHGPAAEI